MQESFDHLISRFDFPFPPELIANAPAKPRDSAKLLVYNRASQNISHSTFRHLAEFLPKGTQLVLNETKVIPARLPLIKQTGGMVPLLVLGQAGKGIIRALSPKPLKIGEVLHLPHSTATFEVLEREEKSWLLKFHVPHDDLQKFMEHKGSMPLPPYIKHTPLTREQQREQYQTVFAKVPGSIAAPTASLHFTDRLLKNLEDHGVHLHRVVLHVHLGTFAPLTEDQWKKGELHTEHYEIPEKTARRLEKAKAEGQKIVAVGTTVTRALESACDAKGRLTKPKGDTSLFLHEERHPRFVNGLITNFHVPKSSLLMLVASFIGRDQLMKIYEEAIGERYRLFSFGDGMLII